MSTMQQVKQELADFLVGADDLCTNLDQVHVSGAVVGTILAKSGPLFAQQKVRDGKQPIILMLKKGKDYYHVNLFDLLLLAQAASDMPEELDGDGQWSSLMTVDVSSKSPEDFVCYVLGDHLDPLAGTALTFLDGKRQAFVANLCLKGSGIVIRLNLASLLAMARYAYLPDPDECEEVTEIREAVLSA